MKMAVKNELSLVPIFYWLNLIPFVVGAGAQVAGSRATIFLRKLVT